MFQKTIYVCGVFGVTQVEAFENFKKHKSFKPKETYMAVWNNEYNEFDIYVVIP